MTQETSLARLQELLDRQDILDCLTRISRGIDRFDRALFLSGYHADALIDAGQFVDAIRKADAPVAFATVPSGCADHIRYSIEMGARAGHFPGSN